ncbi:MAG: sigma-70 family RNA polymerase sigma factor [Planctomycetes bacterium]|nr:sigma-70 family RNA polymerase sigma factor [Planctomycetota bacterium]
MANVNLTTASDGELLCDFIGQRRHEAFAEIVRRHGALVLGVCRSVLGNVPDAEDAAQAVFLAFFRKAASLKHHPALAGWLHQVAWYVASHEKRAITTRTRHEQEATAMKWRASQIKNENVPPDLLHEGLSRLPEKYRLPIILHHLEGRSQEEVANVLGKKVGTVASLLTRGRQILRDRLVKTGAVVSAAGLAAVMTTQASAAVPAAFVGSITNMVSAILTTKAAAAGAASAKILALSKGALNMLLIAKVKVAALVTAAVLLVGGTAASTYVAVAAGPGNGTVKPPAAVPSKPAVPPKVVAAPPKTETVAPASPSTPAPSSTDKVTVVEITDKVLVKDTRRLGVNIGDDNVWNGAVLVKKRVQDNFEGTLYRQCHWGPTCDAKGVTSWYNTSPAWDKILLEGTYTVLSGPNKQTSGKLKAITTKEMQGKQLTYFELDKEITEGKDRNMRYGLLVENLEKIRDGQFRPLAKNFGTTTGNQIVIGDTPPGSFGCAALCLKPDNGPAWVGYPTPVQRFIDNNGAWRVEFWAKTKEGAPKFTVSFASFSAPDKPLASQTVELTNQWKKHQLTLKVEGFPEPKDVPKNPGETMGQPGAILLQSDGGQVLLDDVEAWKDEDKNPTVLRDDAIAAIKLYNPSVLRFVQMGGNSLENTLMPPIKAYSFTNMKSAEVGPYVRLVKNPVGLHDFYQLCEYLEIEPWYCVPGTLHLDEAKALMEYLGGPADSKFGKIRAELGHPKPWTETFKQIHVEFGNEAWNDAPGFMCGGFNGPDYWMDLIETGKKSPYYKPNVLFHAGSMAGLPDRTVSVCKDVPNADRVAIAPYMVGTFAKADAETLNSDEKLFRWTFSHALQRSLTEGSSLTSTYKAAKAAGKELSIYEFNFHTTMGDGPEGPRNTIVTSLAGGVNVANTMLLMLKLQGIRIQNLYSLVQYQYKYQDLRSRTEGQVRLWGSLVNMRKGKERYRPTFLGCALANKVMGGNLVETVHTGANPIFQGAGKTEDWRSDKTLDNFSGSCIWSYAFSDGKKRGLILVNLDLKESLPVELKFQGKPKGAMKCWTMTADNPAASNEFENEKPQVSIAESQVQLESGGKLSLPPCSMQAFAWEVE